MCETPGNRFRAVGSFRREGSIRIFSTDSTSAASVLATLPGGPIQQCWRIQSPSKSELSGITSQLIEDILLVVSK